MPQKCSRPRVFCRSNVAGQFFLGHLRGRQPLECFLALLPWPSKGTANPNCSMDFGVVIGALFFKDLRCLCSFSQSAQQRITKTPNQTNDDHTQLAETLSNFLHVLRLFRSSDSLQKYCKFNVMQIPTNNNDDHSATQPPEKKKKKKCRQIFGVSKDTLFP